MDPIEAKLKKMGHTDPKKGSIMVQYGAMYLMRPDFLVETTKMIEAAIKHAEWLVSHPDDYWADLIDDLDEMDDDDQYVYEEFMKKMPEVVRMLRTALGNAKRGDNPYIMLVKALSLMATAMDISVGELTIADYSAGNVQGALKKYNVNFRQFWNDIGLRY